MKVKTARDGVDGQLLVPAVIDQVLGVLAELGVREVRDWHPYEIR